MLKSEVDRAPDFSFAQARRLIGDLTRPNPAVYWIDFLASILIGHTAINLVFFLPQLYPDAAWMIPAVIACYAITVLTYMRALMFIHELVHLPKGKFKAFRFVWNMMCGILLFVPSFLYYPHVDHHRRKHYGTEKDGEYLALSHRSPWLIVGFIVQALLIPFLGIARFVIISPICWIIPGARRWVHRHASTMLVDPTYERTDGGPELMRTVVIQEFFCFAWGVFFLTRGGLIRDQWLDPFWLVGYLVAVGLLTLNEFRTLGAHRWTNEEGEMSFEEQLLDTVNYPHAPWFSELWGPVGTRYHALHHLFPSLPLPQPGESTSATRRRTAGRFAVSPNDRQQPDKRDRRVVEKGTTDDPKSAVGTSRRSARLDLWRPVNPSSRSTSGPRKKSSRDW